MSGLADWEVMEREIARKLGGRLTPGSGNQSIKGDVVTRRFVIEAKWRSSESKGGCFLTLEEGWLTKTAKQAASRWKEPVLVICIGNWATYYLVKREFWIASAGKLDWCGAVEVDCTDRRSVRLHAADDHSYHVLLFSTAGAWVVLPETDFRLLTSVEESAQGDGACKKSKSRRARTPEQIERARAWRKQRAQRRREWKRKRNSRAPSDG